MGQQKERVWELFMSLTGLDQFEIQKELNPIIKKLKIDLDKVTMDDIRKIVVHYMKSTLDKRIKSVDSEEADRVSSHYTH
jgi:hypothetical protein